MYRNRLPIQDKTQSNPSILHKRVEPSEELNLPRTAGGTLRLELPEAVVNGTLNIDRKSAVAGNLHRR